MLPLLQVEGLGKRFGGVVAVADVSLHAERGEILGIIGPNGAGKSTLISLIAGARKPTTGRVLLDGRRIDGLRPYRAARLGVGRTYQTPRPFRGMTVRENVKVGADRGVTSGESCRRVDHALGLTGLMAFADRDAGDLNLLQLKRLELARALSVQPSLLLLDEIGAGLTAAELRSLVHLLASVRESGIAIIVIEHVIDFIMEVADRIVVMERGRVRSTGSPDEVARDPLVIDAYLGVAGDDRGGDTGADDVAALETPHTVGSATVAPTSSAHAPADTAGSGDGDRREPLLAVSDLVMRYGKVTALNGVTLEVAPGEAVAVLGPNGAGKSTLCRALIGLARPASGAVLVDGHDVSGWPATRRVRECGLALCPEGRHVFAEQTVVENLLLGGVTSEPKAVAARLDLVLDLFPELRERTGQAAGTLSGGEQQMLAIGRSLLSGPRALIVDELSLGLTPQVAMRIYESLHRMLADGLTIVVIEQHVGEALWMARRAYVLERGRVAFADTSRHIRESRG